MDGDRLARMVDHERVGCLVVESLKGPYTRLSSGCSLWLQCGGRVSMTTPLFFVRSTVSIEIWVSWLSSISNTGCSFEHLVDLMK